jgi:hypothetical protein
MKPRDMQIPFPKHLAPEKKSQTQLEAIYRERTQKHHIPTVCASLTTKKFEKCSHGTRSISFRASTQRRKRPEQTIKARRRLALQDPKTPVNRIVSSWGDHCRFR